MRILRVITSVNPEIGGPIEGVTQTTRILTALGHHTEVASLDMPSDAWTHNADFPVHALGVKPSSYGYSNAYTAWLRQKAAQFDLVIVHGLWQYTGFGAWQALHDTATPYLVYPHGMLDPWFKRTYPLKHLKKSLYWPWGEYRVLRDAQAVLFTCEEEKVLAAQSFWPYTCNSVVVNYGTASPSGDAAAQRDRFYTTFPPLRDKRLLLFLSRIHVKKGCDLLLHAFAQAAHSDSSLHLVMAGPDKAGLTAQLQQQARTAGIEERITWTGMLSGDLKWGAFHAAEAFVLPSHQENFGIAVVEAMACGCPVLLSNKVNIWREIQAGGAGLVAEDTREGTTTLLKQWLAKSPVEQAKMGQKARDCFNEHFELNRSAEKLVDTFQLYSQKRETAIL